LHLITVNDTNTHTHTLDRTPLNEGSARRKDLYLTTHSAHKRQSRNPMKRGSQTRDFDYATTGVGIKTPGAGVIFRSSVKGDCCLIQNGGNVVF